VIGALGNIAKIPELKRRILMTLGLLAVYRVGCQIPLPQINRGNLEALFGATGQLGGLAKFFSMFSGGALERMSIFALGIMPYISASIILELLTVVIPHLAKLKKEGEEGRKKITKYTRYGTVVLALFQGAAIAVGLQSGGKPILPPGLSVTLMTMVTLAAGTTFLMWLGEQITERGIGNGISLIIFAGIVAGMPNGFYVLFQQVFRAGSISPFFALIMLAFLFLVVAVVVFFERAQRRIPVQYAKRVVGRRIYGGQTTHLPLKINTAGVIPPIFASSIILFPTAIARFSGVDWLERASRLLEPQAPRINDPSTWVFYIIFVGLIVFFCYFYTAVQFNPADTADNMKKQGGFIPGIRPGKNTAEYIDRVLTRLTLAGAIYVATVCVLPRLLTAQEALPAQLAYQFGGTALLIVVGVALDTMGQIEAHMLTRHYQGFLKKGMKGGSGG
jgi:preprotein translocase subunit SecY